MARAVPVAATAVSKEGGNVGLPSGRVVAPIVGVSLTAGVPELVAIAVSVRSGVEVAAPGVVGVEVGPGVDVRDAVGLGPGVFVRDGVGVTEGVSVREGVSVWDGVRVLEGVCVGEGVYVWVAVLTGVLLGVGVLVAGGARTVNVPLLRLRGTDPPPLSEATAPDRLRL